MRNLAMRDYTVIGCALMLFAAATAHGQEQFSAENIKRGAGMYAQNCTPC